MRFLRTAQAAPPEPAAPPMDPGMLGLAPPPGLGAPPDLGAPPGLGMPPGLGAPPGLGGAAPAMPMAAPGAPPSGREEIGSPLDTLGKILYDVDITTFVMSNMDKEPADIAKEVWELYGGDKFGDVKKNHKGERVNKENVEPAKEQDEQERTEKTRWKRLPAGKTIADIASLDEMVDIIKGLTLNIISNEKKKGAGGGGGGMPSLAASKMQVRLACVLDLEGDWSTADRLDRQLGRRRRTDCI